MFEQERKMQYLQTPALERRTKRVIPGFYGGFWPVRSLLDAVGPSLLSAPTSPPGTTLREGYVGPKPYETNPTPTHSSRPPLSLQFSVSFRSLIYSREKSFYLSYGKHWSRILQSAGTRPAEGNIHTCINFNSSPISE